MELEQRSLTAVERIKQLDVERERILSEAKNEALSKAQEAVAELKALGISYDLREAATPKRKPKRQAKGGPCPICAFETAPPHDARRHRTQGDDRRPFTADELAELGLTKVA